MKNEKLTKDRYNFIKRKATLLLNSSHNKHPFYLADAFGIRVIIYPLTKGLPGFIADNTIYINSKLDSYSKKIVCAHELGHYMLHENMDELFDANNNTFTEFETNLFIKLLMPQVFSKIDTKNFKSITDFNKYIEHQINYVSVE